jgi:hypothetical protein
VMQARTKPVIASSSSASRAGRSGIPMRGGAFMAAQLPIIKSEASFVFDFGTLPHPGGGARHA